MFPAGTVVFAYAYVITIPSWLNEKKPDVNVNKAVWVPATIGLVCKASAAILGSFAFVLIKDDAGNICHDPGKNKCDYVPGSENILNFLANEDQPPLTQYSAYLWSLFTIIPGIPVVSIIVRYVRMSRDTHNIPLGQKPS